MCRATRLEDLQGGEQVGSSILRQVEGDITLGESVADLPEVEDLEVGLARVFEYALKPLDGLFVALRREQDFTELRACFYEARVSMAEVIRLDNGCEFEEFDTLLDVAAVASKRRDIVCDGYELAMSSAEKPLAHLEGPFVVIEGLVEMTLSVQHSTDVVEDGRDRFVFVTVGLTKHVDRLSIHGEARIECFTMT